MLPDCTFTAQTAPKGWLKQMSEENMDIFDEEEMDNLVYLSDDEGNEMAFEYLDTVEYQGNEYVVLISTDEDDDEVVILQLETLAEDDEGDDTFIAVEDESVAEAVFELFKERNKDYYNFG